MLHRITRQTSRIMSGEMNLEILIRSMNPRLQDGEYVFCVMQDPSAVDPGQVIGLFREQEGWTVVMNRTEADRVGMGYDIICKWITLQVHSSLSAVGLTAAFSSALAKAGISCNVMAGFYHDHLFVDVADGEKAMQVLLSLSSAN